MAITSKQGAYALAGVVILFVATGLGALNATLAGQDSITICHATGSASHPYVAERVNVSSDGSLPGHRQHIGEAHETNHTGDIIPAYDVTLHDGSTASFAAQGDQSLLADDCGRGDVPDPSGSGSPSVEPSGDPSGSPSVEPSDDPSGSPSPSGDGGHDHPYHTPSPGTITELPPVDGHEPTPSPTLAWTL